MRATSGTYNSLSFPLSELFLEAFATGCELFGPAIQQTHMSEARRSANLMLQGKWGNKGPNLGQIGDEQLVIPLQPGIDTYLCPPETISILDAYLRTYTPSSIFTTLGNVLTAVGPPGNPLVTQWGDPALIAPGSQVFTTTAGIQECTMRYPAHGLIPGSPLFWGCPITIGGFTLYNFSIVDRVLDGNNLTFLLPAPALETQVGAGGTPLFFTNAGSPLCNCISPGHNLQVGSVFNVPIQTSVGGFTLSGQYTVTSVLPPPPPAIPYSYQFSFIPTGGNATSTAMQFENNGQINVATQLGGLQWSDIYIYPLSRNDYAMQPNKRAPGPPTQYWFNRTIVPQVTMWPVPPAVTPGQPPFFAFVAYRMRAYQDANPVMGQTLDAPSRFYEAFCYQLGASMALKFKPAKFMLMETLAKQAWDEASEEDREKVSSYIAGDFQAYFR